MKFKKKLVIVDAIQFNGNTNKSAVEKFVGRELKAELESETAYVAGVAPPLFSLLIETKEGIMKAFPSDYIIKEPFPTGDRDFYPCKPDIFEKTYVPFEAQVSFGDALEWIKSGGRACRVGWNGSGMFIVFSPGKKALPAERFWSKPLRKFAEVVKNGEMDVRPCIMLKTAQDDVAYWSPSGSDALAEDWILLEE